MLTKTDDLQDQLRERVNAVLCDDPFLGQMDRVTISETLVEIAIALRDFNGGIGDTLHAAKCMHQIVDETAVQRNPNFTQITSMPM